MSSSPRWFCIALVLCALGSASPAAAKCSKFVSPTKGSDAYDFNGGDDWPAHYQFAGKGDAVGPFSLRYAALSNCFGSDLKTGARLYADLSLLCVIYGRMWAGWSDKDPAAPAGDRGRASRSWADHYLAANSTKGSATYNLLMARLGSLAKALPPEVWARLYADASLILVSYDRAFPG